MSVSFQGRLRGCCLNENDGFLPPECQDVHPLITLKDSPFNVREALRSSRVPHRRDKIISYMSSSELKVVGTPHLMVHAWSVTVAG
jgi:hypothetical protein